ncbi:MAG: GNAT family N-acetyltransferase [Hylemonella sp.]|nr:GNAT family N-acetyltransferase [Hylemonella sp.]
MNSDPRELREITLDNTRIASALALSNEANWNQVHEDWKMMLQLGRGFGFATQHDELVASAITLPFSQHCAWISMVLVTSAWQRHGLATRLMRRAIDSVESQGLVPMLDATPAGQAVYQKLGFVAGWSFCRWWSAGPDMGSKNHLQAHPDGLALRRVRAADWEYIRDFDQQILGASRLPMLRELALRLPDVAWVAERDGQRQGFLLGRTGRHAAQLGPLAASDDATACALLKTGLQAVSGPVYVDALDSHPQLLDLLLQAGFSQQRPFTRMALPPADKAANFGNPEHYYAVAGPELA